MGETRLRNHIVRAWPSVLSMAVGVVLGGFALFYFDRATGKSSLTEEVTRWTSAVCGSVCLFCGVGLLIFGVLMARRPPRSG